MNILTDPEHLKNLLRSLNFKPKDYMGQNFLVDETVLQEIISAAEIKKSDTIVEIGPGLGVMTGELAKQAGRVIAVEKDHRLYALLKKVFRDEQNIELVEKDVLKFNFEQIEGDYKIVANIPYYLTSHLLQMLLNLKHKPERLVLMMQKEVGERLVAPAGELSVLGISVQIFAQAEIIAVVSKQSFWPVPKVDSCVVLIRPENKYPEIGNSKLFFQIVKIAFAGKRKQIHNTLANGLKLSKEEIANLLKLAKIDVKIRPQDMTLEDWLRLYKTYQKQIT